MKREALRETIRRQLTHAIVDGSLESGRRIRLVETAQGMGVSMTPLRESLVQLELDGFVNSEPGKGYSVPDMTIAEVEELYPLIWTLEVLAMRTNPPPEGAFEELGRINERFASCDGGWDAMSADREWHSFLLSGCGNRTLLKLLNNLKTRAARYEVAFLQGQRHVESSVTEHALIVEHLREGDLGRASIVLEDNWRSGPKILVPWLRRTCREPSDVEAADA